MLGKEHQEKTGEQRIPQLRDMLRGAKLTVGLRSTRGGREKERDMISISELSAIAESRPLRGHRWERPAHRVSNRKGGQPLVVQSNGRTRSRSATTREERENGPVLNSPWLRGWCEVVGNDVVMFQVNQQRLHSRTKPRGQDEKGAVAGTVAPTIGDEAWRDRFGSVRGGPVLRRRRHKDDDQGRQADRKTDGRGGRMGGRGELRGGDVPSRRVSPFTLLSYKGRYHSRWPQGRRGRGRGPWFFFLSPHCGMVRCHPRRPEMGGPGQ